MQLSIWKIVSNNKLIKKSLDLRDTFDCRKKYALYQKIYLKDAEQKT